MPPMGRRSTGPDVASVLQKAEPGRTRGRGHHSPLYLWLYENHDALAKQFGLTAPSWPDIARNLGDKGVFDGDGKAPTARGARGAWSRVRDQKKREGGLLASPPPDSSPSKGAVQLPSTENRLPLASERPRPPAPAATPRRTFGFATPKDE